MKVYPITPRGYCKGVVHAIELAKRCAHDYPDTPIHILGMIVHNQYIVDALAQMGIHTVDQPGLSRLELLDQIDEGIVLITAHGAGQDVFDKAQAKGLTIIDATCTDVIKTHTLIKTALDAQQEILYIGKKGHPEAEGTIAIDPEHIHLITSKQDIDAIQNHDQAYLITNQTTMSLWDVYDLCEYAQKKLPNIQIAKETCQATRIRQEAIAKVPEEVELVIIVGDPHSNNTAKLAAIANQKAHKEVIQIESVQDLSLDVLKGKSCVAISSGASTPTYLTNQIIAYLQTLEAPVQSLPPFPSIDKNHILD